MYDMFYYESVGYTKIKLLNIANKTFLTWLEKHCTQPLKQKKYQ